MHQSARKSRSRLLWITVLLLALAGVAAYWFMGGDKNPHYLTSPVTRGSFEDTVLASGVVESANLVSVGAQVSGQLKSLKVELGDKVKTGQLVAEIDSLPQQNTLRIRTAALAVVYAQKQAKEAALRQAALTYRRQKTMLAGDASSRADFEAAEATLKMLQADIASLDAQIEQAKVAMDTAELDLGYTQISSPINGVVVAIVTKEGQTVNASQTAPTIIKVAELDRMLIKAEISEADVIRVHPGQKAYFSILGEPDSRYPAELQSIEPAPVSISNDSPAQATSSSDVAIYYMGILDVPNSDGKLRISMTAQVHIVLAEAENALLIPAAALGKREADGRYEVRVQADAGNEEHRLVRVGLNNNVQAEVLEGLSEGEHVIIGEETPGEAAASGPQRPRSRMPRV